MKPSPVDRVTSHFGIALSKGQLESLEEFQGWLASEAVVAGAIGPGESSRLESRHIADSLTFAGFIEGPEEAWDLGSGAGLPGIPLAIVFPDTRWKLVDRSGKRADLLRRAIRILRLSNAKVLERDIYDLSGTVELLVSRASLPPDRLRTVALAHLVSGGVALAGGSWERPPRAAGWQVEEIPPEVLDRPVWLLMMRSP